MAIIEYQFRNNASCISCTGALSVAQNLGHQLLASLGGNKGLQLKPVP
jgi:hypothetical protein